MLVAYCVFPLTLSLSKSVTIHNSDQRLTLSEHRTRYAGLGLKMAGSSIGGIFLYALLITLILLVIQAHSSPIFERTSKAPFCRHSNWTDIVVFVLLNYVAHAATVPSSPGYAWQTTTQWAIVALFLPFAGFARSYSKIFRALFYGRKTDDIDWALRQGAIYAVARNEHWLPAFTHNDLVQMKLPENFLAKETKKYEDCV